MTRLQLIKNRIAFTPVFVMLALVILLFSSGVMEISSIEVWLVLGIIFVGVTSLRRMRCALYIANKKSRILIEHGHHSATRNPFYFFSFIGLISIGLLTESLFLPLLIVLAFFLFVPSEADMEEAKLQELYGKEFEDYMAKVPQFFQKSDY